MINELESEQGNEKSRDDEDYESERVDVRRRKETGLKRREMRTSYGMCKLVTMSE